MEITSLSTTGQLVVSSVAGIFFGILSMSWAIENTKARHPVIINIIVCFAKAIPIIGLGTAIMLGTEILIRFSLPI